jgi:hypothetical protein
VQPPDVFQNANGKGKAFALDSNKSKTFEKSGG